MQTVESMRQTFPKVGKLMLAFSVAAFAIVAACGGAKYPNCDNDEGCNSDGHKGVCMDGKCVACRDDKGCATG